MPKTDKQYKEDELIALFKSGQKEYAFNLIIKKYQERLYWHIRKIVITHDDTDDVLQNTFIKIWKGLDGFRADAQLFTWLYRIATNESLSFLKTKKRHTMQALEGDNYDLSEALMSDPYFCGDEVQRKLQAILLKLPERQRLVFNMKYFDHLKYTEIAEILETSVGNLKALYHHSVKKIENLLTEE